MSFGHPRINKRLPRDIVNLQDHRGTTGVIMDMKARNMSATPPPQYLPSTAAIATTRGDRKKAVDYDHLRRSRSQGSSRRLLPATASHYSLEALLLLVCLTASLLVLPLILPPLPPPPFMLLLLPIGILVVLMTLAFMPFKARDITYTYV